MFKKITGVEREKLNVELQEKIKELRASATRVYGAELQFKSVRKKEEAVQDAINDRLDTLVDWLEKGEKPAEPQKLPFGESPDARKEVTINVVHYDAPPNDGKPLRLGKGTLQLNAAPPDAIDGELVEDEGDAIPDDPRDAALFKALHMLGGAGVRCADLKIKYPKGVPDRALETAIKAEFTGSGSLSGGALLAAWVSSPVLKFWYGKTEPKGKPTLEGARLKAEVRRVLNLTPTAGASKKAKPRKK